MDFLQSLNIITIYHGYLILLSLTLKQRVRGVDCSELLIIDKAKGQISVPIISALAFVSKSPLQPPNRTLNINYSHNSLLSSQSNFPTLDLHDKHTIAPAHSRVQRALERNYILDRGNCRGLIRHMGTQLFCSSHLQLRNSRY
jgi:hypothetical protein